MNRCSLGSLGVAMWGVLAWMVAAEAAAPGPGWAVATFEADITVPIGHACMGGGVADAKEIVDPLFAKGFVLRRDSADPAFPPVVVLALDWCQCNNDSYDRWRDVLAEAAGTTRQRVLLATVHQHDAPICDLAAQRLLDQYGLKGWNCDPEFHERAVQRVAEALRQSLAQPRRVTHVGIGQGKVERVASNRRVVTPEGKVHWGRGSASGDLYGAPEGEIDPWLKTISLWDGDRPVVAWSCYAVHPMSYYGRGGVSADFPGLARARRQKDDPSVFQVYFTGCAGDTTVGKYNTGAPENRPALADRLYQGMVAAWNDTKRRPIDAVAFRLAELHLPPRDAGNFTVEAMQRILADPKATRWQRISAALGLSWRQRVAAGRPIDVPCLDFNHGTVQFVIMPAESFVGYQLAAQRLRPDSFVVVAGFGDGAPGYIPTDQCWKDGYHDDYCWVAPMTEKAMVEALARAMAAPGSFPAPAGAPQNVPFPQAGAEPGVREAPAGRGQAGAPSPEPRIAAIRLDVVKQETSPEFCWFHPRVAAIPGAGRNGRPSVILTLQKHLRASDHYSGLYTMRSDDLGATWTGPTEIAELAWVREPGGVVQAVCDVTPGWHAPTRTVLAIGVRVRYGQRGEQLTEQPRSTQTAYAVFDPPTGRWTPWTLLELPKDDKFNIACNGCGQWLVEADGTVLVPVYFVRAAGVPYSATVLRCAFDGRKLAYLAHGDELSLAVARGLCEPSAIRFGGRYYLTLRNDVKGYVTRGTDGLRYEPIRPWTFDDGRALGSYNTQQHWLAQGDGLFLCYTRRGANNDHIFRHRAPLFIARVDPDKLHVLRATEQVLIPERGVPLGNFGAATIDDHESWVTDAEYLLSAKPHPRGADGSVFVARVKWAVPDPAGR